MRKFTVAATNSRSQVVRSPTGQRRPVRIRWVGVTTPRPGQSGVDNAILSPVRVCLEAADNRPLERARLVLTGMCSKRLSDMGRRAD